MTNSSDPKSIPPEAVALLSRLIEGNAFDLSAWVEPSNSGEMTARLRAAASPDSEPTLLLVAFNAGHGLGSTRSQGDDEVADVQSFIMWQTGHPEFQPA